ncbi:hypothetical protein M885DRAFT_584847 [Pelagophyceae sp. CCMP2097]|nr:hypothetical protein M885DRAFT_584847 [Pelagophyceae sp. CCMP2097]|eukprot:CAMPEP_0206805742 /NCGR_PEP_ID=MMETSP0975-20121206/4376_1 /ASSEMBLY_ACC=CAM_ASM_000399 /TAXON_ID=483370 /ORGANISM="non described non described, Strain CCMP2097" /LENGTH=496 /DNA_ID=CAMNT_0054347797 /DNA_START=15 /DNA_END=1505 /DNA_ORIENTATION=-
MRTFALCAALGAAAALDDSRSWYKRGNTNKDCAWVSEYSGKRCTVKGFDRTLAQDACLDTCTQSITVKKHPPYNGPIDQKIKASSPCDGKHCFNRYSAQIPMAAMVPDGSVIEFETTDLWDEPGWDETNIADANLNMDLVFKDIDIVHILTGPVGIIGAKAGDKVSIEILDITPVRKVHQAYTFGGPGLGFLSDILKPEDVTWAWWDYDADGDCWKSPLFPDVIVPYKPFPGSLGVLPSQEYTDYILETMADETGIYGGPAWPIQPNLAIPQSICGAAGSAPGTCLRTLEPGAFFGNTDSQRMMRGTTLVLDCMIDGCGIGIGDVHGAQGDGEVSITGIEMAAKVVIKATILRADHPAFKAASLRMYGTDSIRLASPGEWISFMGFPFKEKTFTPAQYRGESGSSALKYSNSLIIPESMSLAGRNALHTMNNFLVEFGGYTYGEANVLTSVMCDLRVAQLVDKPAVGVEAVLALDYFKGETYKNLKRAAYPGYVEL